MIVGELIVCWRKQNRYGVREAANIIGLSAATLNRIERGGAIDGKTMHKLIVWAFDPSKDAIANAHNRGGGK